MSTTPDTAHAPSRIPTYPLAHSFRQKPRRLPLVLRFAKGSIHSAIYVPVVLHCLFTALIVYLDTFPNVHISIPATIIPSLSIVVGLMLVFRNSTSYDRFWSGRNCVTSVGTAVRNLARILLVNSQDAHGKSTPDERRDTERTVRVLVAVLYAIKHNLRAEFNIPPASLAASNTFAYPGVRGASRPISRPLSRRPSYVDRALSSPATPTLERSRPDLTTPLLASTATLESTGSTPTRKDEYVSLLPPGLMGYEDRGLGLPLQLCVLLESYVTRAYNRGWINAPLSSQLTVQINSLVDAYGRMETIRTTPLPIAHLIHASQVLFLYLSILPFTMVDSYGWYSVPVVAIVGFTLYGIEGIGVQLEDPFGYDRNDIKMDGIVEDAREEVVVLLEEWREKWEGGKGFGGMF
ncbi:Bestrophin, RFP-TM, chloride channel-domain-containing protein [Boeremia exigua]|uniref:Bestrophin, RFP-TM, chloride channel-domain-containing protein n=1 Tax=Boeremia exigua TaxID=749465 RepID=UPI001E8C9FE6|nr:Bestrophin, RFP-TM, chloride channel-domain-containing protein [Boeremia exigua]KAH6642335.1 Bestrophin, RFP-TM, chloride channel-domain-containing protein [Boeremia exigua]